MNRKSIRLPLYDYSSPGEYFITICVKNRVCILGEIIDDEIILSDAGAAVSFWISQLRDKYPSIQVNHSVIMPNHIHLIIEIAENINTSTELYGDETTPNEITKPNITKRRKMLLPKAIGFLKMNSAKQINLQYGTSGSSFWQGNYFEHIIRDLNDFNNIVRYIDNNPLNWDQDIDNAVWKS